MYIYEGYFALSWKFVPNDVKTGDILAYTAPHLRRILPGYRGNRE